MTALLEMRSIVKTFPGVRALDGVNLSVAAGEIHAVVGENGAGKSTLMKVLSGVYPAGSFDGEILFDGKPALFRSIRDSEAQGIIIIHQELALVPLLSIAENLFLGNEIARGGIIQWNEVNRRAKELLGKVGISDPPETRVEKLGVGKQQLVEIAKALAKNVRLLILDEPTAALSESDSDALLALMLELKSQGVTQIIISHKLNEIRRVADSLTVLRDGATVSSLRAKDGGITEDRIVRDMVGREMAQRYPARARSKGAPLLEIENWSVQHPDFPDRQAIKNISFNVHAGEVVGIAGLMGAGRTELAMSLFGRSWGRDITGTARVRGKITDISRVDRAIAAGLAYVTEDRKALGLILEEPIQRNITMANLSAVARHGLLIEAKETQVAEGYRKSMNIRTPSVFQKVMNLSGGNQQKVVLSKWLFTQPDVLILDEPTRGIDVG
ncbi:MAG: sugar ABC transporter ATP-binding protein, partial [Roseinatronobacter sp.]|nr:sugar ABC transporter ATP-binding protein [Roseinatronobacter sp.]